MIENRKSKLKKRKAKDMRIFIYILWFLIFALDVLFKTNGPIISFSINGILLGSLIYIEIYSKKQ